MWSHRQCGEQRLVLAPELQEPCRKAEKNQRECNEIGSIPSLCAITSGGKLKARFVIHAAACS